MVIKQCFRERVYPIHDSWLCVRYKFPSSFYYYILDILNKYLDRNLVSGLYTLKSKKAEHFF